jgi:hypothetical protein
MKKAERIAEQLFLERKSTERRIASAEQQIAYWARLASTEHDQAFAILYVKWKAQAEATLKKLQH